MIKATRVYSKNIKLKGKGRKTAPTARAYHRGGHQQPVRHTELSRRMEEAAQHVKTAMITYAIRDSEYNGIQIKQGDIIGLHNGQIEFSGNSIHDVVMDMMKTIVTDEDELITVYYGADVTESDAESVAADIEKDYDFCDVECHNGGQPLYYYLISVE